MKSYAAASRLAAPLQTRIAPEAPIRNIRQHTDSLLMQDTTPDPLLARADAALEEASQLRLALMRNASAAQAICSHASQSRLLLSGLIPAIAIALAVSDHPFGDR
ncbi:hypothetical protein [Bradyrhizobium sp. DASA03120]|uniref:hypothetical protein n=1 Tax=Bradyrhizobium sp. SMVTL-02 TaxID=3395917 RepID=UPI003F72F51E